MRRQWNTLKTMEHFNSQNLRKLCYPSDPEGYGLIMIHMTKSTKMIQNMRLRNISETSQARGPLQKEG